MTRIFKYDLKKKNVDTKIVFIFETENVAIPVEIILSPDKGMEDFRGFMYR